MPVHQAFRFELDPSDRTRSALASHAGASRFAYNWGLRLVRARLAQRDQIRQAALRELLSDDEVERLARTVEVPWTLPALRKEWNREKAAVAPWWAENSKEAYSSGLDALARALDGFAKARRGERSGTVGFPRFKKRWARRSCRFRPARSASSTTTTSSFRASGSSARRSRRPSSASSSTLAARGSSPPPSPKRRDGGSSPSAARSSVRTLRRDCLSRSLASTLG